METEPPATPSYWSNWGPRDGPVLYRENPPCIGVLPMPQEKDRAVDAIGIAYPAGWIRYKRALAAMFRLEIGKEELDGRWVCDGRRFVPLGEAAE